jgi:hypothetical protein
MQIALQFIVRIHRDQMSTDWAINPRLSADGPPVLECRQSLNQERRIFKGQEGNLEFQNLIPYCSRLLWLSFRSLPA